MDVVDQVEVKEAEKHGGAPYMAKIENIQEAIYDSDNQFECSDKQNPLDKKNETNNKSLNDAEHNGGNNNNVQHSVSIDNKAQEIWVETLSDNGKTYYYHAITRDTTWIKPDGPKIKIIQQGKKESGDNISQGSRLIDSSNPMNVPNRNQGLPNNHKNHGAKQEMIILKSGVQAQQQNQPMPSQLFPPQSGFPLAVQQTNFNGPPFSVPPPGYSSNHHHGAPWGMPWGLPNKIIHPDQVPKNLIIKHGVIDPNIINRAAEWSEHRAPDGRPYYYHAGRSESVWDKPQAIRDLEAARIAAHSGASVVSGSGGTAAGAATKPLISQTTSVPPIVTEQTELKTKRIEGSIDITKREQGEINKMTNIKKTASAVTDKTRPVSSTPIGGTPWCVVWTGDGRVFFYNPSTRLSVWERPAELLDRADVDKAIANAPQKQHSKPDHEAQTCIFSENQSEVTEEPRSELDISLNLDIPVKKAKIMETKIAEKPPGDVTKEAAIEAEVRASKERALVPLETRVKSFKEMLREKDVSAFSTWEKELHKIVFDPRYLLLTSRERKQIFDKYVKDRAEEERKEKRYKMRQKRDNFRELLESAHLHPKCSFSEFAQKYGKDDKFKAIDKNKERESLFNEFIIEIRKREREEKIHQKEMIKKNFMEMLREKSDITRHSRWIDIKKKIESDNRYRSVDSSFLREEYFMEFCHILKEERKKNKEKTNERDQKKKNREKRKSEENHADHSQNQSNVSNTKSDEENERKQKERDRQLRAEQSIKDREKEVQRSLANHLRDRDKEREHHKRDEAVQHFNALLADLVRNSDLTWKEVKKQLKKDHRWELIENLERESRERFFNEHIESLIRKKRENFREMLDELSLELTCSWKDVKKNIKNDPRFLKYNNERSEREFRDYIKDKTLVAKTYLRELLQECKLITHKSYESVQENIGNLKEIEEILRNDRRYLMLNHMEHERSQIILTYLEDLYKKGPPPPPTATETARRK